MKDIFKITGLFPAVWAWFKEPLPALFDVTPRLSGEATLVAEIFVVAAFSHRHIRLRALHATPSQSRTTRGSHTDLPLGILLRAFYRGLHVVRGTRH
jgi:hypothetical protein